MFWAGRQPHQAQGALTRTRRELTTNLANERRPQHADVRFAIDGAASIATISQYYFLHFGDWRVERSPLFF